jgi:hypothetical protein
VFSRKGRRGFEPQSPTHINTRFPDTETQAALDKSEGARPAELDSIDLTKVKVSLDTWRVVEPYLIMRARQWKKDCKSTTPAGDKPRKGDRGVLCS